MRIDVHAHYFPTDYVELLADYGLPCRGFGQSTDLSSRLAELDKADIDTQILSAVGLDTQIPDPEKAMQAARFINDAYKDVEIKHNKRFRAFGWVPLPYVDLALEEATRCLDELEFAGIAMPCFYQRRPLDDPEFDPFWDEMNRREAVVYIHPVGSHSNCDCGMADYGLHTAWGSPTQLGVTATRLVYSGVASRFPNIKFIFAVCGGFLPYQWHRIETNLRRGLTGSANAAVGNKMFSWVKKLPIDPKDPMAQFKKFYYDTSVQDVPAAMLLVKESYGVDQLLLGSDEIFASVTEIVDYIKNNQYLNEQEKTQILDKNAQKLFCFK